MPASHTPRSPVEHATCPPGSPLSTTPSQSSSNPLHVSGCGTRPQRRRCPQRRYPQLRRFPARTTPPRCRERTPAARGCRQPQTLPQSECKGRWSWDVLARKGYRDTNRFHREARGQAARACSEFLRADLAFVLSAGEVTHWGGDAVRGRESLASEPGVAVQAAARSVSNKSSLVCSFNAIADLTSGRSCSIGDAGSSPQISAPHTFLSRIQARR